MKLFIVQLLVLSPLVFPSNTLAEELVWDPEKVQLSSSLFQSLSIEQIERVERAEQEMMVVDQALAEADAGLRFSQGFTSVNACSSAKAQFDTVSGAFGQSAITLQQEVDAWVEATQAGFTAAVSRALFAEAEARGVAKIAQCPVSNSPVGPKPSCPGTDVSTSVRDRIDTDDELAAEVARLRKDAPKLLTVKLPKEPLPGCGEGAWFDVIRVIQDVDAIAAFERAIETARANAFDEAQMELQRRRAEVTEPGDWPAIIDEVQRVLDQRVEAITNIWVDVGAVVLKRVKKQQAIPCPFGSEAWAGCTGDNQTDAVLSTLGRDRGLEKALAPLREQLKGL